MQLPFQSIECFLYDVSPIQAMQEEGVNLISRHAKETQLSASLEGYSDEGVPLLKIYRKNDENEVFCLNKELVQLGYASKQLMEMTYAEAANSFDHNHNHSLNGNQDEQPAPSSGLKRAPPAKKTTNGTVSSSSDQDEHIIDQSNAPPPPSSQTAAAAKTLAAPATTTAKSNKPMKSPNKPNGKYPAKFGAPKTAAVKTNAK